LDRYEPRLILVGEGHAEVADFFGHLQRSRDVRPLQPSLILSSSFPAVSFVELLPSSGFSFRLAVPAHRCINRVGPAIIRMLHEHVNHHRRDRSSDAENTRALP